jgi:hypothetical protein
MNHSAVKLSFCLLFLAGSSCIVPTNLNASVFNYFRDPTGVYEKKVQPHIGRQKLIKLDLRSSYVVIVVEQEMVFTDRGYISIGEGVRTEGRWSRSKGYIKIELHRKTDLEGRAYPEGTLPTLQLQFEGKDLIETDSTADRFIRQS